MTKTGPVGVGFIGAGNISDEYLTSLTAYPDVTVVGVADIDLDRAAAQARKYGVGFSGTPAELLARDDVELVVNLTIPAVHGEVALSAVEAGKHVWGEKPLTLDRESALQLLAAAEKAGVVVGNAPDTVLGSGIQNSHRLVGEGQIGDVQTVLTLMQGPGPDSWHPRPEFLFARGAGPLFDIGPYYFTTLAMMLGPIANVEARGHRAYEERTIGSGPNAGTRFPVEIFTHVSVLTTFASGVVGTSIYSFDSPVRRQLFELTGSAGAVRVPVSGFDGPTPFLAAGGDGETWVDLPATGRDRARGVGVLEMARAVRAGATPRCSGELAYHVLDAMLAVEESIASGEPVAVTSTIPAIAPLDGDWDPETRTL
jgi:predicted dehydrogenase